MSEKRKKQKIEIFQMLFFILGIITFLFFFSTENFQGMFISILMIFASDFLFAIIEFEKRMAYILFLASFFSFMLGRMAMDFLSTGDVIFYFDPEINVHILIVICISLIFLQIGVVVCETFTFPIIKRRIEGKKIDISHMKYLQICAKVLFYISAFFAILLNVEQIIFIHKESYLALYKEFISNIPRLFQILGNMHIVLLMIFLATCPERKKCVVPIIFFATISVTLLFAGDRGMFICNFATIIVYFFWRQYLDHERWINKKILIIGIGCVPIVIAGMSFYVYIREGIDIGEKTFLSQIDRFFRVSGNTIDILGYGKEYQSQFPKSFYSFGELIDYIKYNPISQILFDVVKPKPHTKEYAMTMHSYAHTISYFITPEEYLLGHGKGSAYIAEVYLDFGYMGVVICNLVYGMLLAGIYKIKNFSPFIISGAFISLRILFYVPRGAMILPLSYILNITTVFAMLLLWTISKLYPYINKLMRSYEKRRIN